MFPFLRPITGFTHELPKAFTESLCHILYDDNHVNIMCRTWTDNRSGHCYVASRSSNNHIIVSKLRESLAKLF